MSIQEEMEKLYNKRRLAFSEQFESDKAAQDMLLYSLKSLLYEKSVRYIVISPLYSSFITHSYECRIGGYDQELYLGTMDRAVYVDIPKLKNYIEEDLAYIRNTLTENVDLSMYEKQNIEYEYSLKYMELIQKIWEGIVCGLYDYLEDIQEEFLLRDVKIIYSLYMEQGEELCTGGRE